MKSFSLGNDRIYIPRWLAPSAAVLFILLSCPIFVHAAEFRVVDKLTSNGYAVLKSSAEVRGLLGISTGTPYAALDIVSTGTASNVYAQIWRNGSGVEVASMTSEGTLYATVAKGDNLGSHTATQDLNLAQHSIVNAASMTMVGKGLQIGTDLTASANGIFISTAGAIMTMGLGNGTALPGARGMGAVDLQTSRSAAAQVASGVYSTVSGGYNNTASDWDTVSGGYNNTANGGDATVSGGEENTASGGDATVSGGYNNTASDYDATVSGGGENTASNWFATVSGGDLNTASGQESTVPGGENNTALGDYSWAGGYSSSSTANGSFTWSDSQGVINQNAVADRTVFKNRGGFLVTGSTNPAMTGALDRGMLVTGNGLVGISTGMPYAALDVVSSGTASNIYAQIWRDGSGNIVSSMTSEGVLYPQSTSAGDNLGNHTATQDLNMAGFMVTGVSTITMLSGSIAIVPPGTGGSNARYGISIGSNTYNNNYYGVGVGFGAFDNNGEGVGVGKSASGNHDSGVGVGTYAYGNHDSGVGVGAGAYDNYLSGVGVGTYAYGNYDSGVGVGAYASDNYGSGVGVGANAYGNANYAVGIGAYSHNNKPYGTALGAYSYAASSSVALGYAAKANAWNSVAIGSGTVNNSTGTASFGMLAIYTSSNVVAAKYYGDGSSLTGVTGSDNLGNHVATTTLNMAWFAINNVSTISASGIYISSYGVIQSTGPGLNGIIGSARGYAAVDLQAYREAAGQVAGGEYSAISGGQSNTASGKSSVVSGGEGNAATGEGAAVVGGRFNAAGADDIVGGGTANTASGGESFIGGGDWNIASGAESAILGGYSNVATGEDSFIGGGSENVTNGWGSVVPGGERNTAEKDYSFAAGFMSSSTAKGAFTWSDSQGVYNINGVADRTVFKNRGGFLITGSTNPAMSGTLNRGMLVTGNGLVGISTGVPYAALDVVSSGTASNIYAQIWRNGSGVEVASMTSQGKLFADGSGLTGISASGGGDSLGTHIATQTLNMAQFPVVNVSSIAMVGDGIRIATSVYAGASGVFISTSGQIMTVGLGNGTAYPNLRGAGAVDLQTYRSASDQVASEEFSVVGGGNENMASGWAAVVGGGNLNSASGIVAVVSGGMENLAAGWGASIGGGSSNSADSDSDSGTIGGGTWNSVAEVAATVGGGEDNSALDWAATVSGGLYNLASNEATTIAGGMYNRASGWGAAVSGGYYNTSSGDYSWAGGYSSSSTANGTFTWSDSQGVENINKVADRTVFKNRGGFLITGSTNPAMTGALDRGMFVAGNGLVGISTGVPYAALDVVSSGTASSIYAQIWRNGSGVEVASMTSEGTLYATVAKGDNLGSHTATQNLNMAQFPVVNVSSIAMVGDGIRITTSVYAGASGIFISSGGAIQTVGAGDGPVVGDARGVGAVDLQTSRDYPAQVASGNFSAISGGQDNTASGENSVVGGGYSNTVSGEDSVVGGGYSNTVSNDDSVVGGGYENTASGSVSVVGGGYENTALGYISVVGGGYYNTASGAESMIGGGENNTASGDYSMVGGGYYNTVSGNYSMVGGGYYNTVSGDFSMVGGGETNTASGDYSWAGGYKSSSTANGTFTWSDSQGVENINKVADRTVFKNRGGFLITGSTNPAMSGTINRGVFVTGNGLVGISTGVPYAALDVVSSGTASSIYAQIWRDGSGNIVSSMTSTGVLYPAVPASDNTKVAKTGDTMTGALYLSSTTISPSSVTLLGALSVANGNVGIGAAPSAERLAVSGNITATGSYMISGSTVVRILPNSSLGIGIDAGRLSTGFYNTIVGYSAGSNATGNYNTVMGYQAGLGVTSFNSFFGYQAGYTSQGSENAFFGNNTGWGTSGNDNAFFGYYAGNNTGTGSGNSFLGARAGQANTTGGYNTFVGNVAAPANTTGSANAVLGYYAGGNGNFSSSTIVGFSAGGALTTGNDNIFIGWQAGYNVTSGTGNIVVGYNKGTSAPTSNNELNIGGLLYGDLSAKTIGISTRVPQAALDIVSTGTLVSQYSQIWRDSTGLVVASMTANGKLTTLQPLPGDNLGNHTATQQLNMGNYAIWSSSAITAAYYQIAGSTVLAMSGTSLIVGRSAGSVNTASNNVFAGYSAGSQNTTGAANSFLGYNTGQANVNGSFNSFYGDMTGFYNTSGSNNVFLGYAAGMQNRTGYANVAIGNEAGDSVAVGSISSCTIIGYQAGAYLLNGVSKDILIGYQAGTNMSAGSGNIIIGNGENPSSLSASNELDIGGVLYGDLSAKTIGISTRVPQAALDIVSTGTAANVYAQIWRNGSGVEVASMTSQGTLYATVAKGDNLGSHTATQDLDMAQKSVVNAASMTMVGKGLQIGTDLTSSASGIFISSGGAIQTIGAGHGTVVGDARGMGAVDLQTYRNTPSQVASGGYSTVGGGESNTASGAWDSTVSGGWGNTASEEGATIGGGWENAASGTASTVAGGNQNIASGHYSIIGGGDNNVANDYYATVGGGVYNVASGASSVVSGGSANTAAGSYSAASGGDNNTASGDYSVVAGGTSNSATQDNAFVGGGDGNVASGAGAVVPGGWNNSASGEASWAGGSLSSSTAKGSFTWSDGQYVLNINAVEDRTVFKNRGGFLITGSTNPVMSGTLNRGMFVTGNGLVGISTGVPYAALDVVSTGTLVSQYAQIWRDSTGLVVASMTANGKLSTLQTLPGDNLGNHTATQDLLMGGNDIYNASTITATGDITAARYQINGSTVLAILPGAGSIGIGLGAGLVNTAISNTFAGYQAGYSNVTGDYNTFLGNSAGWKTTSGRQNLYVGAQAGYNSTVGAYNTFVGESAGWSNVSGTNNAFFGRLSGRYATIGSANTLIGTYAGMGSSGYSYSSSTIVGYQAGYNLSTGSDNTFLGWQAGYTVTSGTGNIVIGYNQSPSAATANNELNIGGILFGNLASGNVGVGTNAPSAGLHVQKYTAGAYTALISTSATAGAYSVAVTSTGVTNINNLVIENRTSDPAAPVTGQIWLRTN